jgi:hypothetical protein
MDCKRLFRSARPAPLWHRWFCEECRAARAADRVIALGLACLRAEPPPIDGFSRVLRSLGLDPESTAQARVRVRRAIRRLTWRLTLYVGSLILCGIGWLYWIDRDPGVAIPTPAMPANNAFYIVRQAGNMVKDDTQIGYALTRKASGQRTGSTLAGADGRSSGWVAVTPADRFYTLREKAALVAENEPALAQVRAALALPYMQPPARSFSTTFPYLAKYRGLARLLSLEAHVKMAQGDWVGAMRSCQDAITLGRHTQHGAGLIGKLAGIACEEIGRSAAWDIVDHLSGPEAREASLRLERIRSEHVTQAEALYEEKWFAIAGLEEIFRNPCWRWLFGHDMMNMPTGTPTNLVGYLLLVRYSKSDILRHYVAAIEASIARSRRPYQENKYYEAPVPSDPVVEVLLPVFEGARFSDTRNETGNALLQIAIALRAYRVERGAFPKGLTELVPKYMRAIPEDPFDEHLSPLRYLVKGMRYVLYSVGPDGADDSGLPIDQSSADGDGNRRAMDPKSEGDIVAGIDRW